MSSSLVQLLVFRFGPEAHFEGGLVTALERLDVGTSVELVDALFVRKDAGTGKPEILDVAGERIGGSALVAMLDFRLDPDARRRATESALADEGSGVPGSELREVVAALAPGDAIAALLVEHVWTRTLDDAVARLGGATVVSRFVDAARLADVAADVRSAAQRE